MGVLLVGKILFPVNCFFVQSSKRSAAPGWQTGGGSRPDEIVLRLVRRKTERREAVIRRAVAMLYSNRCKSR